VTPSPGASAVLPDGLIRRSATAADLPGIMHLLTERGEPEDAVDLASIVASEGLAGVAVVVDGSRVVSTATLLDEVVAIDGVDVPTGQVELVATDTAYEGRGLVRALMNRAHDHSRRRGHLLQVMIGIPYFYRQFGYEYAIPMAPWSRLVSSPSPAPSIVVRLAVSADVPAMQRLQEREQQQADVTMGHQPACWDWLLRRQGSELWVSERESSVVGVARTLPPSEAAALAELAAADDEAALTLVAHAAARAEEPLHVQPRPSTPTDLRALLAPATDAADWYLARVGRLAPLIEHLAPVFQRRLDEAGLGDRDHEVLLSSWRAHVRFAVGASGFRLLADGGPEQRPISKGGSGVPPDALASLVLGPYGAVGLEQRLPDCHLGDQRELMAVLFPPRTADLLTFYLPT
jgi:predicted N-acetyltransferase YhbS